DPAKNKKKAPPIRDRRGFFALLRVSDLTGPSLRIVTSLLSCFCYSLSVPARPGCIRRPFAVCGALILPQICLN
ncbi:hypothetical protein, partial [Aeromonas caviae]|uniref:hypothetical protein n=1 Tax=Aeromonas caviae TaxID=648 RepID=UPI001F3FC1FE